MLPLTGQHPFIHLELVMKSYRNVHTDEIVELNEAFFEGIKHQKNYVPCEPKKKAKRKVAKKFDHLVDK